MDELRRIRNERGLSQQRLAEIADVDKVTIVHIEGGKVSPRVETLEKLARALEVEMADLFPKAQAPLPLEGDERGLESERQAAQPLPPNLRRFAAWRRRALLDWVFEHLTLREEMLRDQAKTYYEASNSQGLFPLYLDAELLRAGADALLTESREEAQELGGETKEERRLRSRLEHRIEDLEKRRDEIGDLWEEVIYAEPAAKRDEENGPELEKVRSIFEKKKAV
jgi:transcriptional regulator with XRE-family HTH domain